MGMTNVRELPKMSDAELKTYQGMLLVHVVHRVFGGYAFALVSPDKCAGLFGRNGALFESLYVDRTPLNEGDNEEARQTTRYQAWDAIFNSHVGVAVYDGDVVEFCSAELLDLWR